MLVLDTTIWGSVPDFVSFATQSISDVSDVTEISFKKIIERFFFYLENCVKLYSVLFN